MVGREKFTTTLYRETVFKLATNVSDNSDDWDKPLLILIYNNCSVEEAVDINTTTADFINTHDSGKSLQRLFSDIKCVALPNFKSIDEETGVSGREIYFKQLKELRVRKVSSTNESGYHC